jgi:hypothetical protein
MAADKNQATSTMQHCYTKDKQGGAMGQNIYWCSSPGREDPAVQAWYDEVANPGYDFAAGDYAPGTGHFTQVVWYNTTHVGMAFSPDGRFIVANYGPPGNYLMPGQFTDNVLPIDSGFVFRPRNRVEKERLAVR